MSNGSWHDTRLDQSDSHKLETSISFVNNKLLGATWSVCGEWLLNTFCLESLMALGVKDFLIPGLKGSVCYNCLGFGYLRGDEETGWGEKMGMGKGWQREPQGLEECA